MRSAYKHDDSFFTKSRSGEEARGEGSQTYGRADEPGLAAVDAGGNAGEAGGGVAADAGEAQAVVDGVVLAVDGDGLDVGVLGGGPEGQVGHGGPAGAALLGVGAGGGQAGEEDGGGDGEELHFEYGEKVEEEESGISLKSVLRVSE